MKAIMLYMHSYIFIAVGFQCYPPLNASGQRLQKIVYGYELSKEIAMCHM